MFPRSTHPFEEQSCLKEQEGVKCLPTWLNLILAGLRDRSSVIPNCGDRAQTGSGGSGLELAGAGRKGAAGRELLREQGSAEPRVTVKGAI